jgi:flavin reductase (DIM6/NTAB) family NADH-FMN oxidoreductase RutF
MKSDVITRPAPSLDRGVRVDAWPRRSSQLRQRQSHISAIESPVALLLAEEEGRRFAMATSFFSEVAHHPATLWISIGKNTDGHEIVQRTGKFSLAVLHEKQAELAQRFREPSAAALDSIASSVRRSPRGYLLLDGALATAECTVRSSVDLDEYTLHVADILSGEFDTATAIYRHLLTTDLTK